jgi:prepilin signal peptidase PulO-like enzyme (type II secretory pathway)
MLARAAADAPGRLVRAKRLALELRHGIPAVPFGIASLTDRVLPHLFPTLDADVFESTLRDSIGIERPPPAGTEDLATDYNSLGNLATNNYYRQAVRKRLLVVMSDGESRFFDEVVLGRELKKGHVHVLFVHVWDAGEKIYLQRKSVDPGYRSDPQSVGAARRIAAAGGGEVLGEDPGVLISRAKAFLGNGPQTKVREQRTRVSLGPYVALAALLPLGFVLLRRNL